MTTVPATLPPRIAAPIRPDEHYLDVACGELRLDLLDSASELTRPDAVANLR